MPSCWLLRIAIARCTGTAGLGVLKACVQRQMWGQLGWTGRSRVRMLGRVMGRLLRMWRRWECGCMPTLYVGWESGYITQWLVHVRPILMLISSLALVSMHVGILAIYRPMPPVPTKPILPRYFMHGMPLATWHARPAMRVLQVTQWFAFLHMWRKMLHHWVSWHGAPQHM